jgi:hypothetical protein
LQALQNTAASEDPDIIWMAPRGWVHPKGANYMVFEQVLTNVRQMPWIC